MIRTDSPTSKLVMRVRFSSSALTVIRSHPLSLAGSAQVVPCLDVVVGRWSRFHGSRGTAFTPSAGTNSSRGRQQLPSVGCPAHAAGPESTSKQGRNCLVEHIKIACWRTSKLYCMKMTDNVPPSHSESTAPYNRRHIDDELDELLEGLPAIAVEGPRAVGKTATALQRARTVYQLDDGAVLAIVQA